MLNPSDWRFEMNSTDSNVLREIAFPICRSCELATEHNYFVAIHFRHGEMAESEYLDAGNTTDRYSVIHNAAALTQALDGPWVIGDVSYVFIPL